MQPSGKEWIHSFHDLRHANTFGRSGSSDVILIRASDSGLLSQEIGPSGPRITCREAGLSGASRQSQHGINWGQQPGPPSPFPSDFQSLYTLTAPLNYRSIINQSASRSRVGLQSPVVGRTVGTQFVLRTSTSLGSPTSVLH